MNTPLELYQLIIDNLEFKSQHSLMKCCKSFRNTLRIHVLPPKYGAHISHELKRYLYLKAAYLYNAGAMGNLNITNEKLALLTNAKYIDLGYCYKITNGGLKHLNNIVGIDLSGCRYITDKGLKNIKNAKYVKLEVEIK